MVDPIQFPFEFSESISFAKEDFIVSNANKNAFQYIQNWTLWGKGKYSKFLILHGPVHSGKTHLSHIFSNITAAKFIQTKDLFIKHPIEIVAENKFFILENLENLKDLEEVLFHLINEVTEKSKYLLITAKKLPSEVNFKLADLNSRINAIPIVSINPPDEELIRTLLIKRFTDKQIRPSNEVINFLTIHLDRSFRDINNVVNYIDKKSIIEKKKITVSLIKEVLEYLTEIKT